jgi:hypothetical protein
MFYIQESFIMESLQNSNQESNHHSIYDLDLAISLDAFGPKGSSHTLSLCGATCQQSACSNHTCDGGSAC